MSLGNFLANATFSFKFDTRVAGEATSLTGSPSYAIYKDDITTEITAGITHTEDFDGKTGLNHIKVDLSASGSYTAGSEYDIVLVAGTVGGVSQANRVLEHFSIGRLDNLARGITKNVAFDNFPFFMVDSTDHVTPKPGLTISATRRLDGGSFAACANSATEVASGLYTINLAASDLNGDVITFRFTGAGADDRFMTIVTEP